MKYWFVLGLLVTFAACQNENGKKAEEVQEDKVELPTKEGDRNRRGFPIGTIQEATELLAGAKAKNRELNRRMTDMMKNQGNGQDILAIGEPLNKLKPMLVRMDSLTTLVEQGKDVDFLSDRDMGKIEHREQNMLDALIDSLSYMNSLFDRILSESDKKLMEELQKK